VSRQLWPVALMLLAGCDDTDYVKARQAACEKAGGVMLIDGGSTTPKLPYNIACVRLVRLETVIRVVTFS
jgi:hypothetical protein